MLKRIPVSYMERKVVLRNYPEALIHNFGRER
jgi:hypothetical protein